MEVCSIIKYGKNRYFHFFVVCVCGADPDGKQWSVYVQMQVCAATLKNWATTPKL